MAKKTLRFDVDENHTGFEKIRVQPTKALNLEKKYNDEEGYALLTNAELQQKLKNEVLTNNQIKLIHSILALRK